MPIELTAWDGLVVRGVPVDPPIIVTPIKRSSAGGSGAFLAGDSENVKWWVKPLNNCQGSRVAITESIVGSAGAIIGAPVCETAIVRLSEDITGWEFRDGHALQEGFAHASKEVSGAQEARSLLYPTRDLNTVRFAGVIALHDWCWGGDTQWLYSETEDRRLYSHDHGWYFPDTGPRWSVTTLFPRVDTAHSPTLPNGQLSKSELRRVARSLRSVSRTQLANLLSNIPDTWPVSDGELNALGWFLERRASPVAERLESIAESIGGGES